ncbi:MjaI family restriction endonuclease [Candidatus Parcubacteria bacterium]|nr:MAG: MjaI family restriction endonuclease [Candidatus Parcubacteria bacterium]
MAKEWILNMATNRWGLNKKRSVGPVSEWIREAMPRSEAEWEAAYMSRLEEMLRERGIDLTPKEYLRSLGERLFVKVTEVVRAEIDEVTLEDCVTYIRNLVIQRTFDGYQREIETVYGQLQQQLQVPIEPASDRLDRLYNVDFVIRAGEALIGLQIKPVTYRQMNEVHRWQAWMAATHRKFTEKYGGKVFVVFSVKEGRQKRIANPEVIEEIHREIQRLSSS